MTPLVSCKKLKAVSVDLLTRIILQETPPDMPSVLMDLFREHNRQSSYDKKQKHFIQELVNFNEKREGDMEKTPSRQLDDEFVYESMETFLSDHFKP